MEIHAGVDIIRIQLRRQLHWSCLIPKSTQMEVNDTTSPRLPRRWWFTRKFIPQEGYLSHLVFSGWRSILVCLETCVTWCFVLTQCAFPFAKTTFNDIPKMCVETASRLSFTMLYIKFVQYIHTFSNSLRYFSAVCLPIHFFPRFVGWFQLILASWSRSMPSMPERDVDPRRAMQSRFFAAQEAGGVFRFFGHRVISEWCGDKDPNPMIELNMSIESFINYIYIYIYMWN